jgi:hypothetical protein
MREKELKRRLSLQFTKIRAKELQNTLELVFI